MSPRRTRLAVERREAAVSKLAANLKTRHSPRLTMLGVVSCAAGAGFLASAVMLWMGMRYMPVRYALAGMAGYGVFLAMMNVWLGRHARVSTFERVTDVVNPLDVPGDVFLGGSRAAGRVADGLFKGGRSGGAGASASFDAAGVAPQMPPVPLMMGGPVERGSSKGFSLDDLDLDEGAKVLPLLAVVAIAAGLIACASVVWSAPQMLAELLVDGAVAGAAYQRLRATTVDWTFGVMRRTWLPATFIVVTFVLLGYAGHYFSPGADSIGDFFR